jgi:6-pyruvoyltetrahydropterin/6-carboxytetrahydropterin synthase
MLGSWIDEYFDHNTILSKYDVELGEKIAVQTGQKIFYLHDNPTAENIAKFLFDKVCPLIFADKNVKCTSIKLYETPNCYVEVK